MEEMVAQGPWVSLGIGGEEATVDTRVPLAKKEFQGQKDSPDLLDLADVEVGQVEAVARESQEIAGTTARLENKAKPDQWERLDLWDPWGKREKWVL